MKPRPLLAAGLLFALSACKEADSTVLVNVSIDSSAAPLYSLRVLMSNGLAHDTNTYPATASATPLPLQTSLVIILPRSRTGILDLAVDGLSNVGTIIAHGTARTTIVMGGNATASVILAAGVSACGNRVIDQGESCDDGNQFSFDGCDFRCQTEGAQADAGLDAAADLVGHGTGGATGAGGFIGTGGITTAGTGGTTGTGGIATTGGSTNTGGATSTGGAAGSGGETGTGGTSGSGGFTATGGGTGTGGTRDTGGAVVSGGISGAAGSGGATGLGGLGGTTSTVCGVNTSYGWASTQSLMDPGSDGSHILAGIKAPTAVFSGGRYHVYATVIDSAEKATIQHISFVDWPNAGSATVDFLDNNAAFGIGRSQPQLFYFSPKSTWYLVTQSGPPGYSTNSDPGQALSWSKPTNFYSSTPKIVTDNAGTGGVGWTDFWVICDSANCHMFFTNALGHLFRAQTTVGNFPGGFGEPVKLIQNSVLLEGARVYKIKGETTYLLLVEGNGSGGRYSSAWTASALDGDWSKWTALANTEAIPFAGGINVTFVGTKWTRDVGHGDLIRDTTDETMTIDPCNMRYLYAGKDPFTTVKVASLMPWKLGLLVRTK